MSNALTDARDIRETLVRARHDQGLTQRDMAAATGRNHITINRAENNRNSPSYVEIAMWARRLGYRLALLPVSDDASHVTHGIPSGGASRADARVLS